MSMFDDAMTAITTRLADGAEHRMDDLLEIARTAGLRSLGRVRASISAMITAGVLTDRDDLRGRMIRRITGSQAVIAAPAANEVKGKCQHEGCYEPADCKHGLCSQHCHRHEIGSYSDRKYPQSAEPHIGVEIEVKYASIEHFRRGVGIDCHRDGSLGGYGAEYKLLAPSGQIAAEASELVETLWKRRARIDRQCGLHVHLDVRQLSEAQIAALLDWLRRTEEAWFGLMPPSRRRNSYVCRMAASRDNHYTWAHSTSYSTVEIRLHGGTLNPYKMIGWLTALAHVQAKAGQAGWSFPSTGDADADFWAVFSDCPRAGREYLAARKACGGTLRDSAYSSLEE